jgi:hypothetical protein
MTRRTNTEVAALTARLEPEGRERDARRDYEYEAKKRLYAECDPVLFQTIELVENARRRIAGLAGAARSNDLQSDGSGWLAEPGYYFMTTAFYLLAPMTSFEILERRLTATILISLSPGTGRSPSGRPAR